MDKNKDYFLHTDLEVYKSSIEFVKKIYIFSKELPDDERFGLISQIRRASTSIPCNIAEGSGRSSTKDLVRFLYISLGSVSEVQTLLILIREIYYKDVSSLLSSLEEIKKMLLGYIKSKKKQIGE